MASGIYKKLSENNEGMYFGTIRWYSSFNLWSCFLDIPIKHSNHFEGVFYSYHDKKLPKLPYTNIYATNMLTLIGSSVSRLEIIDTDRFSELRKNSNNCDWEGDYYIIMQFDNKKDFAKAKFIFSFDTLINLTDDEEKQ